MFKLIIGLKDVGEFATFPEAFREMHHRIEKIIKEGTNLQMLETANWIECEIDGKEYPLMSFGAKDLAGAIGLLKDGKLQDISLHPIIEDLIKLAFRTGGWWKPLNL